MKKGDEYSGFKVKQTADLTSIEGKLYELYHKKTGAKYIHIANKDRENTFAVGFKTVPDDSTGVAHILEHTVLCGSCKYPVKDPFFSMLKRSLNTFMNAFTASDRTVYPFATQNKKDFFNLMSVYLDAVFFPKLSELSFKQEGWRMEFTENDDLVYKGIVFNEMKGAMSSSDQIMERYIMKALYPETTYSKNSGGEPLNIPDLTYENLKKFHKNYYHPSNAFFYSYGDLPLEDNLSFIQENILKSFDAINPETDVASQPRWKKGKKVTCNYPISLNENSENKYQAALAWLTADITDTFEILVLSVLDIILLSTPASPLYKALIDSKLGSTLSDGTGFCAENKDTMFACGLKDIAKDSPDKVEKTILNTLSDLAENGIDKELIDAALHQIEFSIKEVTNHPHPYGLKLLISLSGTWFHGGDTLGVLEIDNDLKKLGKQLKNKGFLESKIKEYFLDNQHRVLFTLEPDKKIEEKQNNEIKEKLLNIKKFLSDKEIDKIKKDALSINSESEEKEDISCLPTLELSDISKGINKTKEKSFDKENDLFCYNKPVSGISYFASAIGAGLLEKRLLSLLPFFCYIFTKTGTEKKDYTELLKNIELYTGGLGISVSSFSMFENSDTCYPILMLGGKCLNRNQEKMFELMTELLTSFTVKNIESLKNLIMEYKADLESMIVHNGHGFAISLASRNLSKKCALNESLSGISQLHYIKSITENITPSKLEKLSQDIMLIPKTLFTKNNLKMAVISDDKCLKDMFDMALSLKSELFEGKNGFSDLQIETDAKPYFEGWSTSSAVSFSAAAFKTVCMPHEDAPTLLVIGKMLRSLYLHREIREKGGAYGGFSIYSITEGIFNLASYRDPHIIETLSVFSKAKEFMKNPSNYTDEDIKEAILQSCSIIDKPQTPSALAKKDFFRKLISLSDAAREEFKKRLLEVNKAKVLNAAEKYFNANEYATAVISNADKLKNANKKLGGRMQVREI
jgi:presequence protease